MNNKQHGSIKHMIMMVLCCGLPILIFAIIPFLGAANTPLKSGLTAITPFICPIMMFFMMPMMMKHLKERQECHDNGEKQIIEVKRLK